jgi:nucleoporin SEH1
MDNGIVRRNGPHHLSVVKVAWAHPEFGQILASCSADRSVVIWEEVEGLDKKKTWESKTTLNESSDAIQDIKFPPRKMGLVIATDSVDGIVRIYEAEDVTDLTHWTIKENFDVQKKINAISWNMNPFDLRPKIVVATDESDVLIYEFNEIQRRWLKIKTLNGHSGPVHDVCWAPLMGKTKHLIASASKDTTIRIWSVKITEEPNGQTNIESEEIELIQHNSEVWRVQWNITGTMLASSSDDGHVRLYKPNLQNKWVPILEVNENE